MHHEQFFLREFRFRRPDLKRSSKSKAHTISRIEAVAGLQEVCAVILGPSRLVTQQTGRDSCSCRKALICITGLLRNVKVYSCVLRCVKSVR